MSATRQLSAVAGATLALLGLTPAQANGDPSAAANDAFSFSFTGINGEQMPLAQYAGKVLLVVNTASQCGFTQQYADLQRVWQQYRDRGLVVLGVPSNDFGGQEPGSEAEIKTFCEVNFDVDFPLTAKEHVKGSAAHPFYRWAAAQVGALATPKWNFHKYLIAPDGRLVGWFSTVTRPAAAAVTAAIEQHLPKADAGT
jgi:glutathione peroxidase